MDVQGYGDVAGIVDQCERHTIGFSESGREPSSAIAAELTVDTGRRFEVSDEIGTGKPVQPRPRNSDAGAEGRGVGLAADAAMAIHDGAEGAVDREDNTATKAAATIGLIRHHRSPFGRMVCRRRIGLEARQSVRRTIAVGVMQVNNWIVSLRYGSFAGSLLGAGVL